jgi:gephyrin
MMEQEALGKLTMNCIIVVLVRKIYVQICFLYSTFFGGCIYLFSRGLISMPIFDRVSLMNELHVLPMNFSFVAESTGHQRSSRLLSMKSANALLEFPATGSVVSAGTPVAAIIISNLRPVDFGKNHISSNSTFSLPGIKSDKITTDSSGGADLRVAILTVSDTVAAGAGPDRRYC